MSKLEFKNQSETSIMGIPGLTFKPLYTMAEICKIFQISKPTIYEWTEHGILRPIKIKARVYFLHQDIQKLITIGADNRSDQ
jgi:predicted DNA-binding transcriptional regulator AlpA